MTKIDPTCLRLLIVDDEIMLRSIIEEYLELMGFEAPVLAGDGREALEMLRAQPFDCMVSDVRMPEMGLGEVLPVITREFPKLIVIATSGDTDFDKSLTILDGGAHDFLEKPLNLDILEIALSWVAHRQPLLELAASGFSGSDGLVSGDAIAARLDALSAAIAANGGPFQEHLRHVRRVASLARALKDAFPLEDWRDLELAALLHEMGSSHIMQSLIAQPRRLEQAELHVVHSHAQISSRLTMGYLGRQDVATAIGHHHAWERLTAPGAPACARELRLAIWLGLLNYVDGCLRDRADRMPYSTAQVHESLKRRFAASKLDPIRQLLEHWGAIEQVYQAP